MDLILPRKLVKRPSAFLREATLTKSWTKSILWFMTTVNVHEAKTHFSKLLDRVAKGEEVTIAKAGRPVARLVPVEGSRGRRMPGSARGQIVIGPDFDDPLPEEIRRAFEE
jgi:prevent-host-death family protein